MPENRIFNEEALRAAIIEQWGSAGAHVEVFDKMLSSTKEGAELTQRIESRITELMRIDGEFCNERWDMSKHPLQRGMAREMSNQCTFARQELQRARKPYTSESITEIEDPKINTYIEITELLNLPLATTSNQSNYHLVNGRLCELIETKINYHINANEPSDFEAAYRELYKYAGIIPNHVVSRIERDVVKIEERKNKNTDIHWRVWNSFKDLPAMQQLLSK